MPSPRLPCREAVLAVLALGLLSGLAVSEYAAWRKGPPSVREEADPDGTGPGRLARRRLFVAGLLLVVLAAAAPGKSTVQGKRV